MSSRKAVQQSGDGYNPSNNHRNTVKNPRSRKQHQKQQHEETICVVVRGTSILLMIPKSDVYHIPTDQKRFVLCEQFNPAAPECSCRNGNQCRWVHANTERATQKHIHVAWAWRSLEEVSYPLMRPGRTLPIEQPTATRDEIPADVVDSSMVLRTGCVFDDPKRPASHCAHFYYGRECHLGGQCDFAHVIYIDENAGNGQRAPPPFSHRRQGQHHPHSRSHTDIDTRVQQQTWSLKQEKEGTPYADQSPFSTPEATPLPIEYTERVRGTKGYKITLPDSTQTTPWSVAIPADESGMSLATHPSRSVTSRRLPGSTSCTFSNFSPSTPGCLEVNEKTMPSSFTPSDFCEPQLALAEPSTPPAPCRKAVVSNDDGSVSRWRYDPYSRSTQVYQPNPPTTEPVSS